MICKCKLILLLLLLFGTVGIGLYGLYIINPCLFKCYEKINYDQFKLNDYFGKNQQSKPKDSLEIKPFRLNISDTILNDLKNRLKNSRFIDHLDKTNFQYGFNSEYLRIVQQYWQNTYKWRKHEQQINSFAQFTTQIEGLDIHFIHLKSIKTAKIKQSIPILLIHGWPGSFYEYIKSISMLMEPDINDGIAYEIVLPSIPGYGYSEQPHKPGFNLPAAARIFVKLMKRLGYDKFITHGGDWGAAISLSISTIYPENVRGVNLVGNFYQPSTIFDLGRMSMAYLMPKYYFGGDDYQQQWNKLFPFYEKFKSMLRETGYMHIQATRPDTVASALMDSPVGLAAYILEKFSVWTSANNINENDGGLMKKFTMDELLTNVMIYWTSGNIAASQRFYLENMQNFDLIHKLTIAPIKVPASILEPSYDLMKAPKKLIEPFYDHLLQFTQSNVGGHFMAFEEPKMVVEDIRKFSKKLLEFEQHQQQQQQQQQKDKHDEI